MVFWGKYPFLGVILHFLGKKGVTSRIYTHAAGRAGRYSWLRSNVSVTGQGGWMARCEVRWCDITRVITTAQSSSV